MTFNIAISICGEAEQWEHVGKLWKEVERRGIVKDQRIFYDQAINASIKGCKEYLSAARASYAYDADFHMGVRGEDGTRARKVCAVVFAP